MADQVFNVNCGFFNSVNGDRKYNAEDMIRPYKNIISNGVFATPQGTPSNKLQVLSAEDGMNIIVKSGDGIFADKWFESPADLLIEVPANPNIVARRDSVIVQIDKRQQGRVGSIIYRTGVAASDPVPPIINDTDNVIEYRIANIYVGAGVTEIGQDVITDLRGSEECLWVTSLIQQVDTSELYRQWQAAYQKYYEEETAMFNAFMERLTGQLNVYTSIITYESSFTTYEDNTTEIPINIPTFNKDIDVLMVKINHLSTSNLNDYTISDDSSKVVLTKPLKANQRVDFLVLKSVVIADNETTLSEVQKLATLMSKKQDKLIAGNGITIEDNVIKTTYKTIERTSLYKNPSTDKATILATLPANMILSEEVENYDEVEIFAIDNEGKNLSTKLLKSYGFVTDLMSIARTSTKVVLKSLRVTLSGTTVGYKDNYETNIMLDGTNNSHVAGKYIGVTEIVGINYR